MARRPARYCRAGRDPARLASPVVLSAKSVTLRRGTRVILDQITVSIGPRTRLGVVGPNGVGKSTLLRILAGLEAPETGTVERSPAQLHVGYLSQEPDARDG